MKIWTQGPLDIVESDGKAPETQSPVMQLHMAQNSYDSFQILLKNDRDFIIKGVRFEDDRETEELSFRYHFQETVSFDTVKYQDPLSNIPTMKVEAKKTQSVWITAHAQAGTNAGDYEKTAVIVTDDGEYSVNFKVKVYGVALPSNRDAAFHVEYWMNSVNFWFRYPSVDQLDFLKYYYGCEKYSSEWWDINRAIAENMKENRINVLFVRTLDLLLDGGTTLDSAGKYHFCWELFDKWTAFFDKYAKIKLFAGYHLVVQTEGKDVYMIDLVDSVPRIVISPIGCEKTESWMEQFLTALYDHLLELDYADRWIQHVEDEPSEPASWCYAQKKVREFMPQISCMDAIDRQGPANGLQGAMDIWIPRVDVYEENREFYDYRLAQGDRRWVYNCCEPHLQNYANKFLGWPLIHNRVLPWGCFVNHFSGFLHWGYNFWDPEDEWFGLNPGAAIKGDGYITYPDAEHNGIRNSVRMIATRDGAQDFELLKLLADRDAKKAYELAGKVIERFNCFNWENENLEKIRIELLRTLESV